MGHSTARAALIYQHASAERDRLIADSVSELVNTGAGESAPTGSRDPDGHVEGTAGWNAPREAHRARQRNRSSDLARYAYGAGDGNRTRVASLED